jgi:hypothetical protein
MARPESDEAAIFNAALHLEAGEARRRYLEQACGANRDRQRRLETLLRVYHDDQNFLQGTAIWLPTTAEELPPEATGGRSARTSFWSRSARAASAWSTWPSSTSPSAAGSP